VTDEELNRKFEALTMLIVSVKESLEREIGALSDKLDRQAARLSLHDGLLNGGARQMTRLIEWSAKIDQLHARADARIAEHDARIRRLENPS